MVVQVLTVCVRQGVVLTELMCQIKNKLLA